eukprot:CAMPEP_0172598708 /NCGR_PEP_ID=MMETSP1068-20121228/18776_1 /TAXON_ID=35684 /ORGANISM="Pseudopedinella elastica, Strain CCMP716" /LENGTH=532 /DNA_ID=CAMNT_0013398681 /DNA_START=385 /DNA_END=1979 /DNA_ORIENTATION=+
MWGGGAFHHNNRSAHVSVSSRRQGVFLYLGALLAAASGSLCLSKLPVSHAAGIQGSCPGGASQDPCADGSERSDGSDGFESGGWLLDPGALILGLPTRADGAAAPEEDEEETCGGGNPRALEPGQCARAKAPATGSAATGANLTAEPPPSNRGACEWDVVERIDPATFERDFRRARRPVLIRGLIRARGPEADPEADPEAWPAAGAIGGRWRRGALRRRLGGRRVSTGDGANIVQTGGFAGHSTMSLGAYLDAMENATRYWAAAGADVRADVGARRQTEEPPDSFNFDGDILASIPELAADFQVPRVFASTFAGPEKRAVSQPQAAGASGAWTILSLGASRTGLPFHAHGETWLGLVFGAKRWFVYPPGFDAPRAVQLNSTWARPLMSSREWVEEVLPKLQDLPLPPTRPPKLPPRFPRPSLSNGGAPPPTNGGTKAATAAAASAPAVPADTETVGSEAGSEAGRVSPLGHRPWECVQHAGDAVYLPAGFKHLTLNAGEALGVGGQAPYREEDKLTDARQALAGAEGGAEGG